jgi:UDP-2,3-diacylglucosamine hydrolase
VQAPSLPRFAELKAPAAWRTVEFISDLHLQASEPATFEAWRSYMAACSAHALFILGDLFEVWVGDDIAREPGFASDCAAVLQATARRLPVFLMHGNRDFLIGDGLVRSCGATLLDDPTVLTFAQHRWLLTHGDALCVSDVKYMQFRAVVRSPAWQKDFLSKPLAERLAMGRQARAESESRRGEGMKPDYGIVDDTLAREWLDAADARTMIHGHTHQPREHDLGAGKQRIVLSDWDLAAQPPRREVLRLDASGPARIALH